MYLFFFRSVKQLNESPEHLAETFKLQRDLSKQEVELENNFEDTFKTSKINGISI